MLSLLGNLDILEVVLIFAVSIMVFGKQLPQVAMRAAAQVMKLRKEVSRMWREAGLEDELRRVRRELEQTVPRHLPTADELIQHSDHEFWDEEGHGEHGEHGGEEPADEVGALDPIDPLSREALVGEPGSEAEPGEEDSLLEASFQDRAEPSGEPGEEPGTLDSEEELGREGR